MSRYIRKGIRIRFPNGKAYSREWLDEHPEVKERVLRTNAHERVSCSCKPSGVEMTIRHRNGVHYLANLPKKSHFHSACCPSYSPDPSTSGLQHYSPGAIATSAAVKHVTVSSASQTSPPFTHLSDDALLQLLWEESQLTHWSPKMAGKRNYFTARSALLSAANSLHIVRESSSHPLTRVISIPQKGDANRDSAAQPSTAGQLLKIVKGPHSLGLVLKYDPRVYWFSEDIWTETAESLLGPYQDPSLPSDNRYVFVLFEPVSTAAGNLSIRSMGLLPITRFWVPAFSSQECDLIETLVDSDRRFFRCLPYDSPNDPAIPIVTLVDTAEPSYIYNPLLNELPSPDQPSANSSGVSVSR